MRSIRLAPGRSRGAAGAAIAFCALLGDRRAQAAEAVGGACTEDSDCAKGLECRNLECADPSVKPASGASALGPADGTPTKPAGPKFDGLPTALESIRGLRATTGLGYGGAATGGGGGGFAWDLEVGWRFTHYFGVVGLVGRTGLEGGSGTFEMVGAQFGNAAHVDLLIGHSSVAAIGSKVAYVGGEFGYYSSYPAPVSESGTSVGARFGYDIPLAQTWALTPGVSMIATPALDVATVIYVVSLGVTWKVPLLVDE